MGAENGGGGGVAGAGVNGAARGQVARAVDHMIAFEGCRPCKLKAGNYRQSFLDKHGEVHEKMEAEARDQRDQEAQRLADAALAKKTWICQRNRRANKYCQFCSFLESAPFPITCTTTKYILV